MKCVLANRLLGVSVATVVVAIIFTPGTLAAVTSAMAKDPAGQPVVKREAVEAMPGSRFRHETGCDTSSASKMRPYLCGWKAGALWQPGTISATLVLSSHLTPFSMRMDVIEGPMDPFIHVRSGMQKMRTERVVAQDMENELNRAIEKVFTYEIVKELTHKLGRNAAEILYPGNRLEGDGRTQAN